MKKIKSEGSMVNDRSIELINVVKNYVNELELSIKFAYVGGSVGRGDADQFSDIDLTVFTESSVKTESINVLYDGEIIQIDILHMNEFPSVQFIMNSPWNYRFLNEITIIRDREGELCKIRDWASDYFHTKQGKRKMIEQVSEIVQERNLFALDCVKNQKSYSAMNAALGAWAEAGFLYLFLKCGSLSTGSLFPQIEKMENHFKEFKQVCPFVIKQDLLQLSTTLSNFRTFLRKQGYSYEFGLSKLQDILCERKIQRLLSQQDYYNLMWQMYGEVFWLYLETSDGLAFENYFENLPIELQEGLSKMGFIPLGNEEVKKLCSLTDELLTLCHLN
ncbi:nucleotidyltransferase domain-containing protein [Bacillus niameyensis]|uniref:nucleotidyltransferase domain-containing protein n=1 Tax=Bacillus niameyensis TaxID=1522308 RepID=UPI0009FFCC04|nr:nucleotidyltransferase domain-containing protein [Bacillus niameyensis]